MIVARVVRAEVLEARRRTYTLTLATVAEMIVARVVRAEVLEARRDKAKTRPHVRRGLQRRA